MLGECKPGDGVVTVKGGDPGEFFVSISRDSGCDIDQEEAFWLLQSRVRYCTKIENGVQYGNGVVIHEVRQFRGAHSIAFHRNLLELAAQYLANEVPPGTAVEVRGMCRHGFGECCSEQPERKP
jgi:hypothetical protein